MGTFRLIRDLSRISRNELYEDNQGKLAVADHKLIKEIEKKKQAQKINSVIVGTPFSELIFAV